MSESNNRRRRWPLIAVAAALTVAGAGVAGTHLASAATTGCRVTYSVTNQWPGGFGAAVDVTNLGDAVSGWQLTWAFTAGQTITQLWNGTATQSGGAVTVTNAAYNAAIATGATVSLGFNGSWTGSNPAPASFALNGVTCTGAPSSTGPAPSSNGPSPSGSPSSSPSTPP